MAEPNEEESFTFVDKRRSSESAPVDTVADTKTDEVEHIHDSIPDDDEPAEAPTFGSYELAAYVVGLLASDAWQKMGLIADPATGKANKDLIQAKFSIDSAAAIVGQLEARQSTVPAKLLADLQRVLNDLRLNFIEQSKR
jgi:hypothetical protein